MNISPAIWLDGNPADGLPLPDRGLDFGDGLFETLLLSKGRPLFPERHLLRLGRGLEILRFPDCLQRVQYCLDSAMEDLATRDWPWTSLRITVTRGGGPRGYAAPLQSLPRVVLTATPLARDCGEMLAPAELAVSSPRWPTQPLLAGLKHLNRLEQVLAAGEARDRGVDEGLMLDQEGRVVSTVAGNLFLVRGDRLLTPQMDQCGIAGTRRALIMERWGPAEGLVVEETQLDLSSLAAADEVFFSNSLLGLRPVGRINEQGWHRHPVCEALFRRYQEEIK